jgi:hypothetical protein
MLACFTPQTVFQSKLSSENLHILLRPTTKQNNKIHSEYAPAVLPHKHVQSHFGIRSDRRIKNSKFSSDMTLIHNLIKVTELMSPVLTAELKNEGQRHMTC